MRNGKIFVVSIFVDILVCTVVVHIVNKDISYHTKVNWTKFSDIGVKYSNSDLKCLIFIIMTPRF